MLVVAGKNKMAAIAAILFTATILFVLVGDCAGQPYVITRSDDDGGGEVLYSEDGVSDLIGGDHSGSGDEGLSSGNESGDESGDERDGEQSGSGDESDASGSGDGGDGDVAQLTSDDSAASLKTSLNYRPVIGEPNLLLN